MNKINRKFYTALDQPLLVPYQQTLEEDSFEHQEIINSIKKLQMTVDFLLESQQFAIMSQDYRGGYLSTIKEKYLLSCNKFEKDYDIFFDEELTPSKEATASKEILQELKNIRMAVEFSMQSQQFAIMNQDYDGGMTRSKKNTYRCYYTNFRESYEASSGETLNPMVVIPLPPTHVPLEPVKWCCIIS